MVNKQYNVADLDAFMKIASSWQNNSLSENFKNSSDMQNYLNPAMNMYKKRERTQNWNHQEKKFLLDLCRKDMRIIENKRLDAGLTAVKNKAWKIIHQKFSEAFGPDRTCNRLKEQWRRMKACTRNEILDYNNRVQRFGQEVADRKKPSPFTFEIWEFMQEAKKQCKSEALDGIDYSKIPLALEEGFEGFKDVEIKDEFDERNVMRTPQDVCDVHIKEEEDDDSDDDDTMNNNNNNTNDNNGNVENNGNGSHNSNDRASVDRISTPNDDSNLVGGDLPIFNGQNNSNGNLKMLEHTFTPDTSFNISNIAATLETLNAFRNNFNQSQQTVQPPPAKRQRRTSSNESNNIILNNKSSAELKVFMEMQVKEHELRLKLLETQLETAKYYRDIVEINKTIALQKLHDIANRRMS